MKFEPGHRFSVRLQPRARQERLSVGDDGTVSAAVTSPPVDDRANAHLVKLLARRLGIAKSSLSIVKGGHGRNKTLTVAGMTKEEFMRRLRENQQAP